jgi:hypothetical protein
MKGYKHSNGNYITGREIEKSQKKFRKECLEARKKKSKEIETQENYYFSLFGEEIRRNQQLKDDRELFVSEVPAYLEYIAKHFKSKYFVSAWDIVHTDYNSLTVDIKRGKVDFDVVKAVYYIALNMFTKLNFQIGFLKV